MPRVIGPIVLMMLLASLTCSASSEAVTPYAQIKNDSLLRTTRTKITEQNPVFQYPKNGVVVGGFTALPGSSSAIGNFITVDFDARATKHIVVEWSSPSLQQTSIVSEKEKPISLEQLNKIILRANEAWNPPVPAHLAPIMDYFGGVTLLNGDDVLDAEAMYANEWPDLERSVKELWYKFETVDRITTISPRPD